MYRINRKPENINHHINKKHPYLRTQGKAPVSNEYQKLRPPFLFFADDIIINGRNQQETQRLLHIIGNWCQANGMLPGFNKCNYISNEEHYITLLNEKLTRTDTYK